jgi:hypothetical protein
LIIFLGSFAFACILAFHNIAEGDLWAKLAIGASIWEQGHLLSRDVFAFTPTLPHYVDHEWGTGFLLYTLLKFPGPPALMLLKMALALGALGFAFAAGWRQRCDPNVLFLLAIPASACLLPGYIPVLRSHTFTYFFYAWTIFGLEELRLGARWPAAVLPLLVLLWANLHGGFVVGLGVIWFYAVAAIAQRQRASVFVLTAAASSVLTLVNPYGLRFWQYLIPALLNPRARIEEWQPLPIWVWDDFLGFRVLFVLTVLAIGLGWKNVATKNVRGLVVLGVTALMTWRSRRHGPFFAVSALAFAGPYYAGTAARWRGQIRLKLNPLWCVFVLYAGLALFAAWRFLPGASLQVLAPVGEVPVREADILSRSGATGNLATPFAWGSYLAWRLYPQIKISMDGRYEATYPESTFLMNSAFFDHQGNWRELIRTEKVNFVILDLAREALRPEDLAAEGYVLIWQQENLSALMCDRSHAALLAQTVRDLPPYTINPLDLKQRPHPLFSPATVNARF